MDSHSHQSPNTPTHPPSDIAITVSEGFWQWLNDLNLSLAFTTYQTNRLFLIGCTLNGRLAVNERLFDKPMGLYAHNDSLYMACRYQLWQLENRLAIGETHQGGDRLYVPSVAYTTGDLNVHDLVLDQQQQLLFINTDFSCLAKQQAGFSFVPVWQPPFISKLAAEDRCHLNGLAMRGGEPTYVTACSQTDTPAGWRNHRLNGGIVLHLPSNQIIATGLSMPHSPRWYRGKLWLLNSGSGELGYLDGERFIPIAFCPGFVRGLAFLGDYAVVGLSKLRSKTFGGLILETCLANAGQQAQCGLRVININTGEILHSLQIEGVVEELFDVVVLPNVRQPRALGFQNDSLERLVNFPDSGGLLITKPTVSRPSLNALLQKPGLPRSEAKPSIQYQQVYHLNPDNLLAYEALTYPSLKARWQNHAQRGELLGVSASLTGTMIGFAVAEQWQQSNGESAAELLSLFVLPSFRHQGIASTLIRQLQRLLGQPLSIIACR